MKKVLISYSQGACLGKCPQYNFTLYQDGTASYEGIMHVERQGKFSIVYPKAELDEINNHLNELQLPALKDDYGIAPDYPETKISFMVESQLRTTVSTANVPRQLRIVHEYINEIMNKALKNPDAFQLKAAE